MGTAVKSILFGLLDTTGGGGNNTNNGKDVAKMAENAGYYIQDIVKYVIAVIGIILILVALVQIAKGLASGGKGQVNWVMSIGCLLVGGLLLFGGWNLLSNVSLIGRDTVQTLAGDEYDTYNSENNDGWTDGGGGFAGGGTGGGNQ